MKILDLKAREVLDSRGFPTVEASLVIETKNGPTTCSAMVPSGASTGEKEAVELRDGDPKRFHGKGVLKAVENIKKSIAPQLIQKTFSGFREIDQLMLKLDGTDYKANLGANALLAVSMAATRAQAVLEGQALYAFLNPKSYLLPVPALNIINGGKHADNNVDFQEFMIAPHNAPSFKESIRMGSEVFHALKSVLKKRNMSTAVGDEGGFAPDLKSNEEALEVILLAIEKAGYKPGQDISLCLDPASSEMYQEDGYVFFKSTQKKISSSEMVAYWENWVRQYPIVSIEDGLAENDWQAWKAITDNIGKKIELVGDDLFCTNPRILRDGIKTQIANSILIKLNQIGTVSETLDAIELARQNNYNFFVSHRSGETEDTFIADLAVATGSGHIKTGSPCRSERIAKFNQLIRIEEELGTKAQFAGKKAFKNQ